ncbi:hypothetical protein LZ32DRAFT_603822 [Colletotrichum eremochloae]|nr:hypothetical protein LZ32DRAFT_603822 [Colletotrichum eremochloae]
MLLGVLCAVLGVLCCWSPLSLFVGNQSFRWDGEESTDFSPFRVTKRLPSCLLCASEMRR